MDPAGDRQADTGGLVDATDGSPRAREHDRAPAVLGLSWLDRMAVTALAEGTARELADLVALARSCAAALCGDDRDGSRLRLVAREIACAKVTLDAMTVAIGDRMRANDERGARLADHFANSATKRLVTLSAEHRACCNAGIRPVVAIAHAEVVRVDGGE